MYAGEDPLTGKRHSLIEIVPPGPKAATLAEAARTRMLSQVDERRNPRTSATLDQLLDRYLDPRRRPDDAPHVRESTWRRTSARSSADSRPARSTPRCSTRSTRSCAGARIHYTGRRGVDHRMPRDHVCDESCRPHACRPLAPATIRHSDAGAQYAAIRYARRLAEVGAVASICSLGDSYDNALAETVIGLYKLECVRRDGPFRGPDDLELATAPRTPSRSADSRTTAVGAVSACAVALRSTLTDPAGRGRMKLRLRLAKIILPGHAR